MRAAAFVLPLLLLLTLTTVGARTSFPGGVRLVGGTPAYPGEFPYTVSIRGEGIGHMCGGAILSPDLIVTAAACADPRSPPIQAIVAGTLFIAEPFPGQQVRSPSLVLPHPGYEPTELYMHNDLCLIFLNQSLVFNDYVSSIRLPAVNQSTFPDPVVMSGWGSEQYGLPLSQFLKKGIVDTYSDEECEVWTELDVREEILCSGKDEEGHGGCLGDAGTPIVSFSRNESYLAAVMSHFPCHIPNCCGRAGPTDQSPELAYYIDWIVEASRSHGVILDY